MRYLTDIKTPESYIYLASPYTGTTFEQHLRYEHTKLAVAHLSQERIAVYSPIVSWHHVAHSYDLPKEATYWELMNGAFVQQCSELWVLMLLGWQDSPGVKMERDYADLLGKVIRFVYFPPEFDKLLVMED